MLVQEPNCSIRRLVVTDKQNLAPLLTDTHSHLPQLHNEVHMSLDAAVAGSRFRASPQIFFTAFMESWSLFSLPLDLDSLLLALTTVEVALCDL